jgi:hypothetical protein
MFRDVLCVAAALLTFGITTESAVADQAGDAVRVGDRWVYDTKDELEADSGHV